MSAEHDQSSTPHTHRVILPIHAREGEYVDIHWRLSDGRFYVQRVSCPPQSVTELKATREPSTNVNDR